MRVIAQIAPFGHGTDGHAGEGRRGRVGIASVRPLHESATVAAEILSPEHCYVGRVAGCLMRSLPTLASHPSMTHLTGTAMT